MENEKLAAGGVVVDDSTAAQRVLLVHRPKYDDWSFPKGKVNAGETLEETALREVKEETGLECRIIRPLATLRYHYRVRSKGPLRRKTVHYFLMKPVTRRVRVPGDEVDRAEWLGFDEAARKLTYAQDGKLLDSI